MFLELVPKLNPKACNSEGTRQSGLRNHLVMKKTGGKHMHTLLVKRVAQSLFPKSGIPDLKTLGSGRSHMPTDTRHGLLCSAPPPCWQLEAAVATAASGLCRSCAWTSQNHLATCLILRVTWSV